MTTALSKLTIAAIIAGSTLISGTAEAATKQETKVTTQYKTLKAGMTIEQAAKILYGKDYKKQLTKKNGSTVLKQKPDTTSSTQGQKTTIYSFYDKKEVLPFDVTTLMFMTKKKSSVYRLTSKSLDLFRDSSTGARESKMKLVKGEKIKTGMTEKQLDGVLSGKGLGEWTGLDSIDMTSIQTKQEIDLGLAIKLESKTYVFPTATKQKKFVMLNYDTKKKTYVVSSQMSF
ncbi:hypothetical protein QK289_14685 [Exiguobacterium antarcticum]|uniref:Lipoprotein n=1 Tax=Exiguobacterium antarcticum TaxID=132920 RepID=A0ABT6R5M5_9BACL|nr:hypothetical protein [Exiguobacterium antarcticum]MDI3236257.1 hypothetical protein [Exiguobacterium antarcticum]